MKAHVALLGENRCIDILKTIPSKIVRGTFRLIKTPELILERVIIDAIQFPFKGIKTRPQLTCPVVSAPENTMQHYWLPISEIFSFTIRSKRSVQVAHNKSMR